MIKITAWILAIVGGIMTAMNYEYIQYQDLFGSGKIKGFEKIVCEQLGYTEKGNYAAIGILLVFISIFLFLITYTKDISNKDNKNIEKEETPE